MKHIFITGGTSGLGLALAEIYLEHGDRVGLCGRDLNKIPQEIKAHSQVKIYQADVLDREKMNEIIHDFAGEKNQLDLVIANAGRSVGAKTKIPDFEKSREVIEVNLFGVLNTYEPATKIFLKNQKGHLAAISSVAGFVGLPGASSYSASKAAVTIFNESLSLDLKAQGITVSTICPGFVDTPLTQKNNHSMPFLMSADKAAKIMKRGLDKQKSQIIFPFPMKIVITFLSKIPRSWYRGLMNLKFMNYSR